MVEQVIKDGILYALYIPAQMPVDKVNFITKNEEPLQVAVSKYAKQAPIRSHKHRPINRTITQLQEVIIVQEGKLKTTIYDNQDNEIESKVLRNGDTIVLLRGGHGFEVLEETKILEIKQGPFEGTTLDKEYLD